MSGIVWDSEVNSIPVSRIRPRFSSQQHFFNRRTDGTDSQPFSTQVFAEIARQRVMKRQLNSEEYENRFQISISDISMSSSESSVANSDYSGNHSINTSKQKSNKFSSTPINSKQLSQERRHSNSRTLTKQKTKVVLTPKSNQQSIDNQLSQRSFASNSRTQTKQNKKESHNKRKSNGSLDSDKDTSVESLSTPKTVLMVKNGKHKNRSTGSVNKTLNPKRISFNNSIESIKSQKNKSSHKLDKVLKNNKSTEVIDEINHETYPNVNQVFTQNINSSQEVESIVINHNNMSQVLTQNINENLNKSLNKSVEPVFERSRDEKQVSKSCEESDEQSEEETDNEDIETRVDSFQLPEREIESNIESENEVLTQNINESMNKSVEPVFERSRDKKQVSKSCEGSDEQPEEETDNEDIETRVDTESLNKVLTQKINESVNKSIERVIKRSKNGNKLLESFEENDGQSEEAEEENDEQSEEEEEENDDLEPRAESLEELESNTESVNDINTTLNCNTNTSCDKSTNESETTERNISSNLTAQNNSFDCNGRESEESIPPIIKTPINKTNVKKKTKTLGKQAFDSNLLAENKTPQVIRPETDGNEEDSCLRRSKRNRFPRLKYWSGQRPVFTRGSNGFTDDFVAINKGFEEVIKMRKISTHKTSKGVKRSANHSDNHSDCGSKRPKNVFNLSLHDKDLKRFETNENSDCIKTVDDLNWKKSEKSDHLMTAIISRNREKGEAFGMLKLGPLAQKEKSKTGKYVTHLSVTFGALSLQIENNPQVIVKTGDYFCIQKETHYSLINSRNDWAFLSFTVLKD